MMRQTIIYGMLAILTFSSCESEETEPFIEDSAFVFIERFVHEASIRDIDIDLKELSIEVFIDDIEEQGVFGFCNHNGDQPGYIVLDKSNWDVLADVDKEFLLFHELGHCILGRQHTNTRNTDGTCVSMMHSTEDACINTYNSLTRTSYLDELFFE